MSYQTPLWLGKPLSRFFEPNQRIGAGEVRFRTNGCRIGKGRRKDSNRTSAGRLPQMSMALQALIWSEVQSH
jgi:hypothetical protein